MLTFQSSPLNALYDTPLLKTSNQRGGMQLSFTLPIHLHTIEHT